MNQEHDRTPWRKATIVAGLVVLAATGLLWLTAGQAEPPVIAVLPFKNLSAEPDSDDFVDGLTAETIRSLSAIDGLAVRSSTSSLAFKNKPRNTREVGRQLNANLVLEGSVLRAGSHLRIDAQLVRVADDVPLWSGRFERELKDIFAIQDEITLAVVNQLHLKPGRGQRRYDTNVEAYELYLKARALIDRRGVENAKKAAELFGEVIAKDSAFAPAYAGLTTAHAIGSVAQGISFEASYPIMKSAAVAALRLDPLLAEAHAAMGWVYSRERDWPNAEKSFRRALELNPGLTQTYTSFSISTLQPLGKLDEALRILQIALRNDPLSLDVQREIGEIQFFAGKYDDAIVTFQRVRAVDAKFPFVNVYLARALTFAGRATEAFALFPATARERPTGADGAGYYVAHAYVLTGQRAEAERLAVANEGYPQREAIIYAALGDRDRTFEALERVAASEPQRVVRLLMAPEMAVLRGDPRLAPFRKKLGLP